MTTLQEWQKKQEEYQKSLELGQLRKDIDELKRLILPKPKEPLRVEFESVVTNMGFKEHPVTLRKLFGKRVKVTVEEIVE